MEYWKPKNDGSLSGNTTGIGLAAQMPKVELPEVGDTMLLTVAHYGVNLVNEEFVGGGIDVVEVQVMAIKKTKVTLE